MNYESLIFDIDGTLWDSCSLVTEGCNICLRAEGLHHLQVDLETIIPLFGKVTEELADTLFPSVSPDSRYDLMQRCLETGHRYMREHPCQVGYPGVRETIEALSKQHRIFIVSNSQSGYPQLCMEKLDLTPFISGHLCYGDTGTSKGQTIRTLMARHNITSCIYIGDTLGDQMACQEAGIPFIFAAYGLGQANAWDARIESITELCNM